MARSKKPEDIQRAFDAARQFLVDAQQNAQYVSITFETETNRRTTKIMTITMSMPSSLESKKGD